MDVYSKCRQCGEAVPVTSKRTTIKKYCSRVCRDSWWGDKRNTGVTWGEWCDKRYGKMEPLVLSDVEKAWLAGIIDGEGTIGVYKERRPKNSSGYRYRAEVSVCGTHEGFIKVVADKMSGMFFDAVDNGVNRKPLYKASAQRRGVRRVLEAVRDYLIIKKEQADICLAFCIAIDGAPKRTAQLHDEFEDFYQRMKKLNQKGIQASPITSTSAGMSNGDDRLLERVS